MTGREAERLAQIAFDTLIQQRSVDVLGAFTLITIVASIGLTLGVFAYPPETVYSFRGDMQKPP
jgi:hypothetical protein